MVSAGWLEGRRKRPEAEPVLLAEVGPAGHSLSRRPPSLIAIEPSTRRSRRVLRTGRRQSSPGRQCLGGSGHVPLGVSLSSSGPEHPRGFELVLCRLVSPFTDLFHYLQRKPCCTDCLPSSYLHGNFQSF